MVRAEARVAVPMVCGRRIPSRRGGRRRVVADGRVQPRPAIAARGQRPGVVRGHGGQRVRVYAHRGGRTLLRARLTHTGAQGPGRWRLVGRARGVWRP